MRAFVAVVPPPSSLAAVVRAVEPLRASLPASWVPPERLHLTLAFLGEVAEWESFAVALASAVSAVPPFSLSLAGGGAFPRPARPRVLWAGVAGDVDALVRLARLARRTARASGIAVERAPFVPHVTVARVRRPDVDATLALAALAAVEGEPWVVREVVLMRSVLGPKPSYEPLWSCPLYSA